jgi:hypothetical protein
VSIRRRRTHGPVSVIGRVDGSDAVPGGLRPASAAGSTSVPARHSALCGHGAHGEIERKMDVGQDVGSPLQTNGCILSNTRL